METIAFDYNLPPELIAQRPPERRDMARLMTLDRTTGEIGHKHFYDLTALLRPGDLLVANNTRVIPARLKGVKPTGGVIEITLIGKAKGPGERWRCLAKGARRLKPGVPVTVGDDLTLTPVERGVQGEWLVEITARGNVREAIEKAGRAPLPPYIHRDGSERPGEDIERYQTVYAEEWGAVAAPTAGLHFTDELMEKLRGAGIGMAFVTLDVGWGSFAPVREDTVENHRVEAEKFSVSPKCVEAIESARKQGGRIIAVGTTTVRALESAHTEPGLKPVEGETDLFITPGFRFRAIDALITNFHLPRSSLIMLAAAFAGLDKLLHAYKTAVSEKYRFYSYGDAMLIL